MVRTKKVMLFDKVNIEIPPSEIDTRLVGLTVTLSQIDPAFSRYSGEEVVSVTQEILRTRNVRCGTWCAWEMKCFKEGTMKIFMDDMNYIVWLAKWESV